MILLTGSIPGLTLEIMILPEGHIFHLVGSDCKAPPILSASVSVIYFHPRE
jgi:hypothetical protein